MAQRKSRLTPEYRAKTRIKMRKWRAENREKVDAYNRTRWLADNYSMTIEEYDALAEAQNGVCAICEQTCDVSQRKSLSVDHCHSTGKIRGLLCKRCNWGLGHFRDDPELLAKAISYLTKPEAA